MHQPVTPSMWPSTHSRRECSGWAHHSAQPFMPLVPEASKGNCGVLSQRSTRKLSSRQARDCNRRGKTTGTIFRSAFFAWNIRRMMSFPPRSFGCALPAYTILEVARRSWQSAGDDRDRPGSGRRACIPLRGGGQTVVKPRDQNLRPVFLRIVSEQIVLGDQVRRQTSSAASPGTPQNCNCPHATMNVASKELLKRRRGPCPPCTPLVNASIAASGNIWRECFAVLLGNAVDVRVLRLSASCVMLRDGAAAPASCKSGEILFCL